MKRKLFACLLALVTVMAAWAQRGPLNGSGKIIQKNFNYNDFDKLELVDLAGKVVVEAGQPFSVSVSIDDNLAGMLEATVSSGTLHITLRGNRNNKLYIEATGILVKIGMPVVSFIQQNGNNNLLVNGIQGSYFRLKSQDNGNTYLNGQVDELELTASGNGNIYAEKVSAKSITIYKSGNADVYVNTKYPFAANGTGNGNVINRGTGRADSNSGISGNGEIKYTCKTDAPDAPGPPVKTKKVNVTINNLTADWLSVYVKYPVQGSYGIGLKPKETIVESLPVGTRLYQGNQFTLFKKLLYTVMAESKDQSFSIK
jgi:hypothetical protein